MTGRTHPLWWRLLLGLFLWLAVPGTAAATQIFPAAEIREAHALRQRILAEIPQLVPAQFGAQARFPEEAIPLIQQRLGVLQAREAENPFFHWAQGEVVRRRQGAVAAAPFFEQARQAAGPRIAVHWLLWQDYLRANLPDEAQREERALQAIQVTWGLSRFPLLAAEQISLAAEVAEAGELARAAALHEAAKANVPESPEASMGLAVLTWQMDKSQLFSIGRGIASALVQILFSPQAGFRLRSNLLLSCLVTWLVVICLVAAIFAIKTQPLFAHELNEGFLKGFPPLYPGECGSLDFSAPLLGGSGHPLGGHRSPSDLWALSLPTRTDVGVNPPGWDGRTACGVSWGCGSPCSRILARVRAGASYRSRRTWRDAGSAASWMDPSGSAERTAALLPRPVLKQRGEVPQAEAEMRKAAELLPRAGFVQVGLGNALYLQGRVQEAEAAYRQAAEITPSSAAAQLNLSRLYVQRLQLDQSEEALARSRSLDPHMVRTVLSFQGQCSAPLVMDDAVPWKNLATDLAPRVELMSVIADGLCGGQLRGISLNLLPYAAVLLVIAFWVYVPLRERRMPARRCEQCGTPFCSKCQFNPKERACCASCAAVCRQREGVAAFVRTRRLREVEEWGRKERMRARILGVVLPGGSDLYQGRVLIGVLLFGATAWLFIEGVVLDTVTPSLRFSPSIPVPFRVAAVLVPLAVLYGYSLWRSRRKISRISN